MWSDYLPQELRQKFEASTGIRIKHTPYGSNEELLNKVKATKGQGFDLISPTNDRRGQWQDLDYLQAFDMNRVPHEALLPSMRAMSDGFSWDGKPRHLPYLWGTEAISWNTEKHTTEYGKLSFGDLWAPEMDGKVMGRPHSLMAGIGLYLDRIGQLPSNRMLDAYKDEKSMRRIWGEITKFAIEHKGNIKQFWNDADAQKNGFLQNEVVMGQTWDGPMLSLKYDGKPINYMAPVEGALTWMDGMAIPVGAKNIDAIYEFISFIYKPENSGMLANLTGYNACVAGADEHLSAESKAAFQEAYPGDALDNLWPWPPTPTWYASIRDEYRDQFRSA
jgi:spermidine/putrescine transport system substrate-binding protein